MNTDHMNAPQLAGLEVRKKIAKLFADGRPRTTADVMRALRVKDMTARHHLGRMRDMGLLAFDEGYTSGGGGGRPGIWEPVALGGSKPPPGYEPVMNPLARAAE